jgi:hypothetical protein
VPIPVEIKEPLNKFEPIIGWNKKRDVVNWESLSKAQIKNDILSKKRGSKRPKSPQHLKIQKQEPAPEKLDAIERNNCKSTSRKPLRIEKTINKDINK